MEVFKRADGRSPYWYADYVHPVTGERCRESLKTSGTREEALEVLRRKLAGPRKAQRGPPTITLRAAVDAYVSYLSSEGKASAGSQTEMRDKLFGLLRHGQGRWAMNPNRPLHTLSPADLTILVKARRGEGNASQTIAHELKLLRAATRYAAGEGFKVPIEMVNGAIPRAWRIPKLTTKTRYLSLAEFHQLYDYLAPERAIPTGRANTKTYDLTFKPGTRAWRGRQNAQDLLVALVMCGGRWSEVARLRWERIDTAALERWLAWREHPEPKGERPAVTMTLWGNKTQQERLVGCPDMICEVLGRRWRERDPRQPLVFPTADGKQHSGPNQAILKAIKACGLNSPERVAENGRATVHSLRHTFASLLIQGGANLAEIQQALGHSTLAMTRRYSHLEGRETAGRLADILTDRTRR